MALTRVDPDNADRLYGDALGALMAILIGRRKGVLEETVFENLLSELHQIPAKMEYLLTSTRQWKRPLEFATYIVKLPLQSKIEDFSLEYDQLIWKNGEQILTVRRKNYMPEDNLRIKWRD